MLHGMGNNSRGIDIIPCKNSSPLKGLCPTQKNIDNGEKMCKNEFANDNVGVKCNNKKVRLKMEHISIPAKKLLDKIASKRVGQTMSELELAGCQQNVKDAVKRQLYGLKKDIEQHIDSEVCYENNEK